MLTKTHLIAEVKLLNLPAKCIETKHYKKEKKLNIREYLIIFDAQICFKNATLFVSPTQIFSMVVERVGPLGVEERGGP